MSIAERRIQSSQEDGMRRIIGETLVQIGQEKTLSDIVKDIVSGDLAKNLARACRVVIPIKRIEIRKSEVLAMGEGEPESIIPESEMVQPEEAAPAEEPAAEETVEAEAEVAEAPAEETTE